jgi:hypothetical protein
LFLPSLIGQKVHFLGVEKNSKSESSATDLTLLFFKSPTTPQQKMVGVINMRSLASTLLLTQGIYAAADTMEAYIASSSDSSSFVYTSDFPIPGMLM